MFKIYLLIGYTDKVRKIRKEKTKIPMLFIEIKNCETGMT